MQKLPCAVDRVLLAFVLLIGSAFALPGCGETQDTGASAERAGTGIDLTDPGTNVYRVRGTIETLPDPDNPASALNIRHEEIPEFVGPEGDVVGMDEMSMPFPLAAGVSLEGFAVGDHVVFRFAVNYDSGGMPWELIEIEKLDADPFAKAAEAEATPVSE